MDTQVKDYIDETVTNHRVVLFMKGTPQFPQCGFSSRAVQILDACGSQYATVNVAALKNMRRREKNLKNFQIGRQSLNAILMVSLLEAAIYCLRCIKTVSCSPSLNKATDRPANFRLLIHSNTPEIDYGKVDRPGRCASARHCQDFRSQKCRPSHSNLLSAF